MRNVKVRYEKISVALLHSGLVYQRKVTDMKRVKNMAEHWDKKLFNSPCVSFRNGMYNVIDGQHTIAAYKMRFGEDAEILCKVAYNLTAEEESEWFYELEKGRISQTSNTLYNSRLLSKDATLLSLVSDLKQAGLMMKINIPNGKCVISALKTIENIHNNMNNIDFISCFKLLKETWNGDQISLKEPFLKGMVKFYNTYKGKFDSNRFKKSLSKVNPKDIKSKADSDVYMKDESIKYARVFVEHYNFKLKKLPVLKISKLED